MREVMRRMTERKEWEVVRRMDRNEGGSSEISSVED